MSLTIARRCTIADAQRLITRDVLATLLRFARRKDAWTPEALVEAGVPGELVTVLVVDPRAQLEAARVSLTRRQRTDPTRTYVWGPDIRNLLVGWGVLRG